MSHRDGYIQNMSHSVERPMPGIIYEGSLNSSHVDESTYGMMGNYDDLTALNSPAHKLPKLNNYFDYQLKGENLWVAVLIELNFIFKWTPYMWNFISFVSFSSRMLLKVCQTEENGIFYIS